MGAFGVWALIENWPDRFAAAVPVCGGGRVSEARRIAALPIWAFHGAADPIVPAHESRRMIAAVERAGGAPRYTEYPFVMHQSWNRAWAERGLAAWVFAHSRATTQEAGNVP
jgi:predicted peptidase